MALGTSPFNCPLLTVPEPARVLYMEAEVKEKGVQKRGRKIFHDVSKEELNENLYLLTDQPELQFDSPLGYKLLRQELDLVQPNILVIDPLGRFLGGLDENSNSEMNKVLTKLDQIIKEHSSREMALVIAHHSRKPDTSANSTFDPLSAHSMRGSSRFFSNPDSIIMMNRDTGKDYKNFKGEEAWQLTARFQTRQAAQLPDMTFNVNHEGDLRVRYAPKKGPPPKLSQSKSLVGDQLQFNDA